jgi:hypothetical protein
MYASPYRGCGDYVAKVRALHSLLFPCWFTLKATPGSFGNIPQVQSWLEEVINRVFEIVGPLPK